jgi:hypothetical protein
MQHKHPLTSQLSAHAVRRAALDGLQILTRKSPDTAHARHGKTGRYYYTYSVYSTDAMEIVVSPAYLAFLYYYAIREQARRYPETRGARFACSVVYYSEGGLPSSLGYSLPMTTESTLSYFLAHYLGAAVKWNRSASMAYPNTTNESATVTLYTTSRSLTALGPGDQLLLSQEYLNAWEVDKERWAFHSTPRPQEYT